MAPSTLTPLLLALLFSAACASWSGERDLAQQQAGEAAAEDDECAAGDEQCALSALQRRSTLRAVRQHDHENEEEEEDSDDEDGFELPEDVSPNSPALLESKLGWKPVTGCHGDNGNACPAGQTCILRYGSNDTSQCVTCAKEDFLKECQELDDYMRYSAVHTCKQTCMSAKCYGKNWCLKPHKCINDKKNKWGQCVDCHDKDWWTYSCFAMSEGFMKTAKRKCHRKCVR